MLLTQLATEVNQRPHYSPLQIQKYVERIGLPKKHHASPVFADPTFAQTKAHGLPLLAALHRHHVSSIPFENLELHYSVHRTISLDMDELFAKFVERGSLAGRGGRCMENNGFFGTVLRSLGYDVRNCAGRVSRAMSPNKETREQQGHTYDGWNHMLNLVRIEKDWWVVDVGMGAMGPNCVYPLKDDHTEIAIPPRKIRLQHRVIPEHAALHPADAPKLWCYDVCLQGPSAPDANAGEQKWIPTYCFTETEFLPQDYEMMSWYTSTHPQSFFTYSVMCTKMLLDAAQERVIGDVTLFNNAVRKTVAGQREQTRDLHTEDERVDVLWEIFGIRLSPEEQNAMRSSSARLG